MLQSLFRPVLRPIMMGVMAVTGSRRAWSPLALWPDGVDSPGMWIDPSLLTASFNDSTGTTPVATPGTVADSANPVGLALDIRAGATVLTDPGNHMLQSTSSARPLMSARVNLLTYTEAFSIPWTATNVTISDDAAVAPDGSLTASKITETTADGYHGLNRFDLQNGVPGNAARSIYLKAAGRRYLYFYDNYCGFAGYFDCVTGIFRDTSGGTMSAVDAGNGWWRFSAAYVVGTTYTNLAFAFNRTDTFGSSAVDSYVGDGVSGIYMWADQCEHGTTATPYQSVPGNGSTYDATGITPFQLYDGVDDGMATASFTAGTLINGMDCMIAVRRDSVANCVAGLYNGIADATKFFGMAESASGSGCVGSGAGTPTVWVDNTQLTGGTAVTRGTLHTALTAGNIHILEFRNLDLSAWTATGFGLYTSYVFPGARGDIMLFESTASTADKDAARQYLADKYGVTLA